MRQQKCLVLVGHPMPDSFNAALAKRYAAAMVEAGAEVRVMELSTMAFDANLLTRKPGAAELTGDIKLFWENLVWCDHFVLVHPLWWGGMPAKLKGLFDLALQSGKAYRYERGKTWPEGLLAGRTARVMVTSDTPGWFLWFGYRNAHFQQVKRQILQFCGFGSVQFSHASPLKGANDQARHRMLAQAERAALRDFAA